jgi:hypothetical protein
LTALNFNLGDIVPNQVQDMRELIQKIERFRVILEAEAGLRDPLADIKPELDNVPVVLEDLRKLSDFAGLAEAKLSEEQEKEVTVITDNLRKNLLLMLNNERQSRFRKDFYDTLFGAQLLLARYWPANAKDADTGLYSDPLLIEDDFRSDDANVIAVSSGHLFYKKSLADYYSRNNAFVMEGGVVCVQDPYRKKLSEREIEYLQANGVKVPRPDQNLLALNRAFGLAGQRVDGAQDEPGARPGVRIPLSLATLRGVLAGLTVGIFIGTIVTILLLVLCPPLPLLGTLAIFATSLATGFIEAKRGETGFFHGLKSSLFANMMLITLTSFIAPQVIVALFTYNIISAAASSAAMGGMVLALNCLPVATFLIGAIRECFQPGALASFYHKVASIPTLVSALTCAFVGGVLGFVVGGVINLFARPVPVPLPAARAAHEQNPLLIDADDVPEVEVREQVINHARIYNGLGVVPGHANAHAAPPAGIGHYDPVEFEVQHAAAAAAVEHQALVIAPRR